MEEVISESSAPSETTVPVQGILPMDEEIARIVRRTEARKIAAKKLCKLYNSRCSCDRGFSCTAMMIWGDMGAAVVAGLEAEGYLKL